MTKINFWRVSGWFYLIFGFLVNVESLFLLFSPSAGLAGAGGIFGILLGFLLITGGVGLIKERAVALHLLSVIGAFVIFFSITSIIYRVTTFGFNKTIADPNLYVELLMLLINTPLTLVWVQKFNEKS